MKKAIEACLLVMERQAIATRERKDVSIMLSLQNEAYADGIEELARMIRIIIDVKSE